MKTVVQHPHPIEAARLRIAVYRPAPESGSIPALARQLGPGVQARLVQRPQEVRATDDLVVVIADAGTFVRTLAETLGALAPPVLVVVRQGAETRLPAAGAASYLVVDRLAAGLLPFAVLATARRGAVTPAAPAVPPAPVATAPLTLRERDIMGLLAAGCSTREIADNLGIRGKTVRNYLSNIYRKLGARRQAEALVRWLSSTEAHAAA